MRAGIPERVALAHATTGSPMLHNVLDSHRTSAAQGSNVSGRKRRDAMFPRRTVRATISDAKKPSLFARIAKAVL